jgi:hypothetical protein
MEKLIISILLALSSMAEARSKALISHTPGCQDAPDLVVYERPLFTKEIGIYSAEAEWEIILKSTGCAILRGDYPYCKYTEALSGSFRVGQKPAKATLSSSGYDLEFNGGIYLEYASGLQCQYEISED